MAGKSGDRSAHFPAIEKKHGKPVAFWLKELKSLGDAKYADQISFLRERHGFSQAHANAVVMYARGSTTTRRVDTPEAFFRALGGERETTARAIFAAIAEKFPRLEAVIAWNQPMLKSGKDYVFGLSAAKNHLLLAPWDQKLLQAARPMLTGYTVNKKTIQVPSDWKIDRKLLLALLG